MTLECCSHDGYEHVENNDLRDECLAKEEQDWEEVLNSDPDRRQVAVIRSLQSLLVELSEQDEVLVDDASCIESAVGVLIFFEYWLSESASLHSIQLQHVESACEHENKRDEHRHEAPNVSNCLEDEINVLS